MPELMRFRILRSPERQRPERHELIQAGTDDALQLDTLAALPRDQREAAVAATPDAFAGDLSRIPAALRALDEELGRAGGTVHPERVKAIAGDIPALVADSDFTLARARLFNTLGAIVGGGITSVASFGFLTLQEYAATVQRLLYIAGLLELIAQGATIDDEDAVARVLRWRTIVLPAGLWPSDTGTVATGMAVHGYGTSAHANMRSGLLPIAAVSRRPAFADLYVVRQDWLRYEPGEIAHIENVLTGEHKKREHRRRSESELTTVTETELQTLDERDTQTTSRFELATEATREMELALHVEGSVDVKYPPGAAAIVSAHVGASVDYSQATSDRAATTTAKEAIEKAVKKIETRTRETRTARTLTTVEEFASHGIDNHDGTAHVVGIYRWVNKVDRAQLYRYPNRFLLEFQIPEPGRWWRWMRDRTRPPAPKPPTPFTTDGQSASRLLRVEDVTEGNYAELGARYGVKAMPAAPAPILRPGLTLNMAESSDTSIPIKFLSYDKFIVPDGYRAVGWSGWVMSWHNGNFGNQGCSVRVAVGGGPQAMIVVPLWSSLDAAASGTLNNLTGPVPIAVMADAPWGIAVTLTIECHRQDCHLRRWQQSVYDMLVDGHAQQREAYERAVRDASDAAAVISESSNPLQTRLRIAAELKKHIIEQMLGPQVVGYDAIRPGTDSEPSIDPLAMRALAPLVSFMEQAFEWENMTYMLYPYFWGARNGWPEAAQAAGTDPEFSSFLSAGSARVLLPARPGFEQVVHYFLHTGQPWGGFQAPAPDEPGYLSIDREIRALQAGAEDGVPVGTSWEVKLPTTLVVLQADGTLPTNPSPAVP